MPDGISTLGLNVEEFRRGWNAAKYEMESMRTSISQVQRSISALNAVEQTSLGLTRRQVAERKALLRELSQLNQGYNRASKEVRNYESAWIRLNRAGGQAKGVMASLGGTIKGIAAGFAVSAIIDFVRDLGSYASQIKLIAQESGTTSERVQQMQSAFAMTGSRADDASAALIKLNELIIEARNGSVEAQGKLAAFGATAEDTADSALLKLANRMKELGNTTDAVDVANETLGNTLASKLMPSLLQGAQALDAYGKAANIASEETINLADKGNKALDDMWRNIQKGALSSIGWLAKVREGMIDAFDGEAINLDTFKGVAEEQLRNEGVIKGKTTGRADSKDQKAIRERAKMLAEAEAKAYAKAQAVEAGRENTGLTQEERKQAKAKGQSFAQARADAEAKAGKNAAPEVAADSLLKARELLMQRQATIANAITDQNSKQLALLKAQESNLQSQLAQAETLHTAAAAALRQELALQIAQNREQQRAQNLSKALSDNQATLNNERATRGVGTSEQIRMIDAERAKILKDIQVVTRATNGQDKERLSALRMQARELQLQKLELQNQRSDEIIALTAQTDEMSLRLKGLSEAADITSIIVNYNDQIVKATREGNAEAVKQLKTQRDIALTQKRAEQANRTGADRRKERQEARKVQRDAQRQERREKELQGRADGDEFKRSRLGGGYRASRDGELPDRLGGGYRVGGRGASGVDIQEQLSKDKAGNTARAREADAAAQAQALRQSQDQLFKDVHGIAQSIAKN